ncbi:MAG: sulfur carrier protein ThiS [Nitrospiraceae bacterium]|nr:sulfur carrier protein ThiS [Nitrospiraceae bacterium]
MNIFVNGQQRSVPDGLTVSGLLLHLEIKPERVAVEINEEIVRKTTYADALVKENDRVEVVQFMGGG